MAPLVELALQPCGNTNCSAQVTPPKVYCSVACRSVGDMEKAKARYQRWYKANRTRRRPKEEIHLPVLSVVDEALLAENPLPGSYAECMKMPRPCPHVRCRYHLYLDVTPSGRLILNFPDKEVWELEHSCAIDAARELHDPTFAELAEYLGMSGQGARQHLVRALASLARKTRRTGKGRDLYDLFVAVLEAHGQNPLEIAQERHVPDADVVQAMREIGRAYTKLGLADDAYSWRRPGPSTGSEKP